MQTAIIFGATSGIGKGLLALLISHGYKVGVTGRRTELLNQLKTTYGNRIETSTHDVQEEATSSKCFTNLINALGGSVDLVIHSSGIGYENPTLDWNKEKDTLLTNVMGATLIYNLVFRFFKSQGYGHLVAISSIASLRGNRSSPAYFASKAFQVNYLESLYFKTKEIPGNQVFITDIRPGFIDTKMALGDGIFWMAATQKACKQIFKAIQKKKRRVYITKRWNLIAWVLKIVPSWLQRKVM